MKRVITALLLVISVFTGFSQVQIRPLPKPGFEQRIREYVDNMKVVDTHEHLTVPTDVTNLYAPDFSLLFLQYPSDDFNSAGWPWGSSFYDNKFLSGSMTVKEKWDKVKPYWEASFNTAYNRAMLLSAMQLFGVETIDNSTVEELSAKIANAYKNPVKWYDEVLKEKCRFEYVIKDQFNYPHDTLLGRSMFRFVKRFDNFVYINSKQDIANLEKQGQSKIGTLDGLIAELKESFSTSISQGIIGIKNALAYDRVIFYENVSKERAEEVFNKILNSPDNVGFTFEEVKPLQDYMMHRVLDLARENRLPVQIHTGLQAGWEGHNIENAKPTHLVNLFQEYPEVKFILFHGSYPYGGELSTLAKNFPNVYIDMCWLYIISPSYSERYLNEWLETVPANKIMAFGGDYAIVEGVYSHLVFAKQVISNVLISKVRNGYFTEAEALKVAQMILHDNAVRIFKLK